jgi:hypothetical protein
MGLSHFNAAKDFMLALFEDSDTAFTKWIPKFST